MKTVCLFILPMVLFLLVAACASNSAPAPDIAKRSLESPADSLTGQIPLKDEGQKDWAKLEAAARKEGKVVISSGASAALRSVMVEPFKERFQVTIEVLFGLPSEVIPKIMAERRAGIYAMDIFLTSVPTLVRTLKPAGILEPLDPIVFLPEALDRKAWYQGDLPWVDRDHQMLALLAYPTAHVLINTNMVKREEVKSYRNLLEPKWRGKMILYDPTKAGASNSWVTAMSEGIMNLDYIREFVRQEPIIIRNERLIVEWVTQGKYPVAIGARKEIVKEFTDAGSPLELMIPVEGTHVSTGGAGIVLLKNAPHPSAAKIFINWILTKEGETLLSKAQNAQSARVDVPTDFLEPLLVRQPGAKYYNASSEDGGAIEVKYQELAKELFAPLLK